MFDHLVVSSSTKRRKTRLRYFGVTAAVWIATLALVVVGGVWSYDAHLSDTAKFIPIGPPQPPPPLGKPPTREPRRESNQQGSRPQNQFVSQAQSPDRVNEPSKTSLPPIVGSVADSGPHGQGSGPVGSDHGVIGGLGEASEQGRHEEPPKPERPKDPPAQPQPQPPTRIVRSGGVMQGTAIRRANPVYPPLARAARVSGAVVVEVVVDRAGNVTSARALSGHALLREAAIAAAMQWRWNPTLLSNVPVQVVGTITFNFTL